MIEVTADRKYQDEILIENDGEYYNIRISGMNASGVRALRDCLASLIEDSAEELSQEVKECF